MFPVTVRIFDIRALYTAAITAYPCVPCSCRFQVDTNQCKMAYDGGEDEYADYYEYADEVEEAGGK